MPDTTDTFENACVNLVNTNLTSSFPIASFAGHRHYDELFRLVQTHALLHDAPCRENWREELLVARARLRQVKVWEDRLKARFLGIYSSDTR